MAESNGFNEYKKLIEYRFDELSKMVNKLFAKTDGISKEIESLGTELRGMISELKQDHVSLHERITSLESDLKRRARFHGILWASVLTIIGQIFMKLLF